MLKSLVQKHGIGENYVFQQYVGIQFNELFVSDTKGSFVIRMSNKY